MTKNEFIEEVNQTIPGINLKDKDIDYIVNDTSNYSDGNLFHVTADITITYRGKTKIYKEGHENFLSREFIKDYQNGYY